MFTGSLTSIALDDGYSPDIEELNFKELAELLLTTGDITASEAEELMGGDLEDDNAWGSDAHKMASGGNPAADRAKEELVSLANRRMWAAQADCPMQAMTNELFKTVAGAEKPGHAYTQRHLSTGGNWVYSNNASASTATGATQRADNRGSAKTTAPARDKSTQTDSHINYRAKVGNKDYKIKAKNPKQKALLEKIKQKSRGKTAISA